MPWWRRSQKQRAMAFLRRAKLEDIENWLRRHLHGQEDRFGVTSGNQPHFSIVKLYRSAEDGIRRDIEFAAVNLVRRAAVDLQECTEDYLSEVFLLTDPIFLYSRRQAEIIDSTLTILREASVAPLKTGIACSAAQALLTLDYKTFPSFWVEMFEVHDETFSPIVVEGLGRSSLKALQDWLRLKLPHRRIERDLINILPFFVEREGVSRVADLLAPLRYLFSQRARAELEADAEAGGYRLHWNRKILEAQLSEYFVTLLMHLLARESASLWDLEEVRDSFREALHALALFLESEEGRMVDSPHSSAMAKQYAQLLAFGLETSPLEYLTYQHVAEHTPIPELFEVTEFTIASGKLTPDQVRTILRAFYSDDDVERIASGAEREARRRSAGQLLTRLPEQTKKSLETYPLLEETEKELVREFLAQDMKVPKDPAVWVSQMAGAE